MRKWMMLLVMAMLLTACSSNHADKTIAMYRKHEALFLEAVQSANYAPVEALRYVQEIETWQNPVKVDFYCGGSGLVPSSSYYGILYQPSLDLEGKVESDSQWMHEGDGYRFIQHEGDNVFYYEPLGNGFYYYEEHY